MACYASDVIKTAIKWIGYHEKASNKDLESFTANNGSANYTIFSDTIDKKYPTLLCGRKAGLAYCATFTLYCFLDTFGFDETLRLLSLPLRSAAAGCIYYYGYLKKANKVGKQPRIGALIFFGTAENALKHVGFVEKFDSNYVYTIEGNTSNQVARRKYAKNNSNIFGYGYPSYDVEIPSKKADTSPFQGTIEINKNEKNLNKSVLTDGKVNTGVLNVRTWAGASNPTLKSVPNIKKDTLVGVCDAIAAPNGDKWYYILINNKTYGFVNSKYIDLLSSSIIAETDGPVDNFNYNETR